MCFDGSHSGLDPSRCKELRSDCLRGPESGRYLRSCEEMSLWYVSGLFASDECELLDLQSNISESHRKHKERWWFVLFMLDFDARVFENCGKVAIECAINLVDKSLTADVVTHTSLHACHDR